MHTENGHKCMLIQKIKELGVSKATYVGSSQEARAPSHWGQEEIGGFVVQQAAGDGLGGRWGAARAVGGVGR